MAGRDHPNFLRTAEQTGRISQGRLERPCTLPLTIEAWGAREINETDET